MHAQPRSATRRRSRGFTLLEVMVVVAIMAVLASLAAPSFTPLIERWRVRQAAEELQSTLYYARSEAIKRGGDVAIVATSGDWKNGWQVTQGSGTTVLQEAAAPSKVSITLAGDDGKIIVDRWGMLSHSGGTATLMDFLIFPEGKDGDTNAARLCAGQAGRIVQKKGSESCS